MSFLYHVATYLNVIAISSIIFIVIIIIIIIIICI
jgi:hypothetical protein